MVQDREPEVGDTITFGVISDCHGAARPAVSKCFVGILS